MGHRAHTAWHATLMEQAVTQLTPRCNARSLQDQPIITPGFACDDRFATRLAAGEWRIGSMARSESAGIPPYGAKVSE